MRIKGEDVLRARMRVKSENARHGEDARSKHGKAAELQSQQKKGRAAPGIQQRYGCMVVRWINGFRTAARKNKDPSAAKLGKGYGNRTNE